MKTIFKSIFFAGAIVLAAGCGNATKKDANQAQAVVEEVAPSVAVAQVFTREVPQMSTYTSTVQAYVKNNIAPQSVNRIKKINVEVGDFVKKGQVLAEMDQIQLQQAELQMQNKEIEYKRLKALYDAGGLSQSDLDAIELAYKVSKTQYENLLENSVLLSPVNGVVTARNYDVGEDRKSVV